jgi:dephospho-CoA kinase
MPLGDDFILFHVYVDEPYIRYQRLVRRKRAGDPNNYIDFAEQDHHEEKTFRTEEATSMQDYFLNNSGTLQDLHRQLDAKLKFRIGCRIQPLRDRHLVEPDEFWNPLDCWPR